MMNAKVLAIFEKSQRYSMPRLGSGKYIVYDGVVKNGVLDNDHSHDDPVGRVGEANLVTFLVRWKMWAFRFRDSAQA